MPRRGLLLLTAALSIGVGVAMVLIGQRITGEQTDTFADAQQSAAINWTLPEPVGVDDGTSPVMQGVDTVATPSNAVFAKLSFRRPGSNASLVRSTPLYVGEGVTTSALRRGPGHYPGTAAPGEPGNVAIAGHRTGWGSPFRRLDELRVGDVVVLETAAGTRFEYSVTRTFVTGPTDVTVLDQRATGGSDSRITLTTCDPPHTSDKRLIVQGVLIAGA